MSDGKDKDGSFGALFGQVEPVKGDTPLRLQESRRQTPGQAVRRQAAQSEQQTDRGLSTTEIPRIDPHAWLDWHLAGLQQGVYRKLRLGAYPIDGRLDVHGMNLEQARSALLGFIKDCIANDIRCALISHGTGARRDEPAVLKSAVACWLPQIHEVLAFHSAQRQHGGLGATYVLLRKSPRKRQQTFEEHSRRRRP